MKRGLFVFLSVLITLILLAGCAQSEADDRSQEAPETDDSVTRKEKILRIGTDLDTDNLDPALVSAVQDIYVTANIFDSLMFYDIEKDEFVEGLAESYDISEDGLTYTFKLREGVQFHKDYGEMTSEDVKFTLERILDPETQAINRSFLETIEEVNTPDDYTVEIKLNKIDPFMLYNLSEHWTGIVSKKAMEEKGEEFNADPIGTGPFMFESWQPQTATTLVKNDNWYRDEIKLDKVVFVPIPEPSTMYLSFENGDLDIVQVNDAERLKQYENDDRFQIQKTPAYIMRYIGFNLNEKPFDDIRVRQALTHGFNREALLNEVLPGLSEPAKGPTPPNAIGYESDVTEYPYDPEKAKQLLAEAGYEDGLEFTLPVPSMDRFMTPATVFQADMEKIGVNVEVEAREPTGYLQETRDKEHPIILMSNEQTGIADFYLNKQFHSSNADVGGNNLTGYRNNNVDAWLDEAGSTLDEGKRGELLSKVQKQIVDDLPMIFIDHEYNVHAVSNRVEGYHVIPMRAYKVYTVDIKE